MAFVTTLVGIGYIAAAAQDGAQPEDELRKIRTQKLQAAKNGLKNYEKLQAAGVAITDVFISQKADWCRKVMETELQLASSKRERIEAAELYLKRISQLSDIIRRRRAFDQSPTALAEVTYRLHEAEELVLLEKMTD